MADVIRLAEQYHDALVRQDMQALARIARAYAGIVTRLQAEIEALAFEIAGLDQATTGQVIRMDRYRRLLTTATNELTRYQAWLGVELDTISSDMIERGLAESLELVRASAGTGAVSGALRGLPVETVKTLLGFLDPEGPLYNRLRFLAPATVDRLAQYIIDSIALGKNPRAWAREIMRVFGIGLTDSLRMARTVQLWSYRESSRYNYIANQDIVRGWIWFARLDDRVCMSCVVMHGTRHPLSEPLDDHYNGRCTALPITITNPNLAVEPGIDWFERQPEAVQKQMMGPKKWRAWRDGKFRFADLSRQLPDEVYGTMRTETPLKDLVSDD